MRSLLASLILVVLAGCSFSDTITTHSLEYNSAIEVHDNTEIAINILRSADGIPLSFSDLSQIRGSIQTQAALQSTAPFGPLRASPMRTGEQATLSVQLNPTFDIAPLNTTGFTEGLMRPVGLKYIALFQQRGIPVQVLVNLFIESMAVRDGTTAAIYTNLPCLRVQQTNCQITKFQDELVKLNE